MSRFNTFILLRIQWCLIAILYHIWALSILRIMFHSDYVSCLNSFYSLASGWTQSCIIFEFFLFSESHIMCECNFQSDMDISIFPHLGYICLKANLHWQLVSIFICLLYLYPLQSYATGIMFSAHVKIFLQCNLNILVLSLCVSWAVRRRGRGLFSWPTPR